MIVARHSEVGRLGSFREQTPMNQAACSMCVSRLGVGQYGPLHRPQTGTARGPALGRLTDRQTPPDAVIFQVCGLNTTPL